MISGQPAPKMLEKGKYLITDPAILNKMQLSLAVTGKNSTTVLGERHAEVTPALVEKLKKNHVLHVQLTPIDDVFVLICVERMETVFSVVESVLKKKDILSDDVVESLRRRRQWSFLEASIRNNLDHVKDLFREDVIEKLVTLTQLHETTVRQSVMAALSIADLGQHLQWNTTKIAIAFMGLVYHDLGKIRVKLATLDWPGRLNSEQWEEIKHHPLYGCEMLYQPGEPPDFIMLSALLHHEWYAKIKGRGYGGLTTYNQIVKQSMKFDCQRVVAHLDQNVKDLFQMTGLLEMVAALEEAQTYKRGLPPFKVLVIMNSDAKLGHFNPEHYKAWHRVYSERHPKLFSVGQRMALPVEKELRVFKKSSSKKILPTPLLTYYELERLGFLDTLIRAGVDTDRIRRQGGFSIKTLARINEGKGLGLNLSEDHLKGYHIDPVKSVIVPEKQTLEISVKREWLTVRELERLGLMERAQSIQLDIRLIRQHGGINPEKLTRRDIKIPRDRLKKFNISTLKQMTIHLPGSEASLTAAQLDKMGISNAQLSKAGCLFRVRQGVNGAPLAWLVNKGIPITKSMLVSANIDPIRKIFYDIEVVEERSTRNALFRILREGDKIEDVEAMNDNNEIGPIRDLLFNQIGNVEIDFTDLLALPDMRPLKEGEHWQGL